MNSNIVRVQANNLPSSSENFNWNKFKTKVKSATQPIINEQMPLVQAAQSKYSQASSEIKGWSTTTKILVVVLIVLVLVLIFFAFIFPKIQKRKLIQAESNPVLISKKTEANKEHTVEAKMIKMSPGETQFSFNIWFYVFSDEFMNNRGNWKHIFHRGTEDPNGSQDLEGVQTPGLWLAPRRNQLWIVFTAKNRDKREKILEGISNIPMNRWNNLSINLFERNLEVFLNGELKLSKLLNFMPIIDSNNVHISKNGGFNGYISKFIYSNQAFNTNKVKSITFKGP